MRPNEDELQEDMTIQAPAWIRSAVDEAENNPRLDALVDVVAGGASLVAHGRRAELLRGQWLGHALHPLLTDFPLGCWIGAGLLDLLGGRAARNSAQRLVGLGLVAVPVTAGAGLADWSTISDRRTRRVGAVHAIGNGMVGCAYLLSWRARRRGAHLRGIGWGLLGAAGAWVTGYLGGHLSFARGVGSGLRGLELDAPVPDDSSEIRGPTVSGPWS
jgi:uncharacterized membrane protein